MKKLLIIITLLLLVFFAVIGVCIYLDYSGNSNDNDIISVTVQPGDGTIAISKELKKTGLINMPHVFYLYCKCKKYDLRWQMGTYSIPSGTGYEDIAKTMTKASPSGVKITIPEGKQVRQIAKLLEENEICNSDSFLEAVDNHSYDYPFLVNINHPFRLEGYLYPDTYYFEKDSNPDDIIIAMLDNFNDNMYTDKFKNGADKLGLSFDGLIILSSIVESEAASEEDRKNVASVFLNRLNNPAYTKLQSCVTVEYALGIKKSIISHEDTQYDSPYNTYMYPGLPVGPICCPGKSTVEDVINHNENNYYYFQSDKNGKMYFAETFAEHSKIQKEVQANWKGELLEDYNR